MSAKCYIPGGEPWFPQAFEEEFDSASKCYIYTVIKMHRSKIEDGGTGKSTVGAGSSLWALQPSNYSSMGHSCVVRVSILCISELVGEEVAAGAFPRQYLIQVHRRLLRLSATQAHGGDMAGVLQGLATPEPELTRDEWR